MNFSSADMSTTLDRILDTAADNLRVAKILVQLGLDPNNVTYDAIFNRLLEIFLHNITLANMFALVGAIFFVATLLTQTMVPLRVANMVGCAFFAGFGALSGTITTFLLYLLMIPINAYRLRQMLRLVKKARSATQGDTSMEWLKPFMTERKYRKGDILMKIEIHHTRPLFMSDLQKADIQRAIGYLVPLCPTCHRVVHRKTGTCMSVADLRRLVSSTGGA